MIFWRKKNKEKDEKPTELEEEKLQESAEVALEESTALETQVEEISGTVLEEDAAEDKNESEDGSKKNGWFSRLTKGLSKSSNKLTTGIADIFTKKKLDDQMLEELEELLITADLGPQTASKIIEIMRKERFGKDIAPDEVKEYLAEKIKDILEPVAKPLDFKALGKPAVVIMAGVNGAGKTTTIGKIAKMLKDEQGLSVMLAAGDTFRAAAVEQLQIWGERVSAPVLVKDIGADAASVAYEAYEMAKEKNIDVLLIDTAGRLQNKANLMEELAKIIRVLKKQDESLPHATLLVLDATTGQNAHSQVETFKEMVNVSGLIVTKLDGSAKGGVLVSLADRFEMPVHLLGVGETAQDLRSFKAEDYARSLLGVSD